MSHVEAHLKIKSVSIRLDDIWKEKNPSDTGESMVEYVGKNVGTLHDITKSSNTFEREQS